MRIAPITMAVGPDLTIGWVVTDPGVIYAAQHWPTNAHMMVDVARLGYLRREWFTLDPTYGLGNFWTRWSPYRHNFVYADKYTLDGHDFRDLPWQDGTFDAVVFDPPYKLNGTPSPEEVRYGVEVPTRWQDRILLMQQGQKECARVLKRGGYLLTKCQDQVVSGKVVWQTDIMTMQAKADGLVKVDRLDFLTNPRPQPHSRQVHARRNYSTLLVFQKKG